MIFWVAVILYFLGPAWVVSRDGGAIKAGLVMFAAAILPIMRQVWFTDSNAPGFIFPLMLMVPPAVIVMLGGAAWWACNKLATNEGSQLPK